MAAYHLAECQWLQQKPESALTVLVHWSWRIERRAQTHPTQANLAADTAGMLAQIVESLDRTEDTLAMLRKLLSHADAVRSPMFTCTVASELSRRYQISADYQKSSDYARQALEAHKQSWGSYGADQRNADSQIPADAETDAETAVELTGEDPPESKLTKTLQTRLHFELPLAWAEQQMSQGRAAEAVEILKQTDSAHLSAEQTLAVRFLLAEALFASGSHAAAGRQFEWLTEQAAVQSPKPAWLAAIALRRGELLANSGCCKPNATMLILHKHTNLTTCWRDALWPALNLTKPGVCSKASSMHQRRMALKPFHAPPGCWGKFTFCSATSHRLCKPTDLSPA